MIAAIHALVLTLALAVPYVAHGECAWVLWSQSPEGYTVVGAHPTVRDCAVATTETVMALQQQGFTARGLGDVQRSLAFRLARFLTSRSH